MKNLLNQYLKHKTIHDYIDVLSYEMKDAYAIVTYECEDQNGHIFTSHVTVIVWDVLVFINDKIDDL